MYVVIMFFLFFFVAGQHSILRIEPPPVKGVPRRHARPIPTSTGISLPARRHVNHVSRQPRHVTRWNAWRHDWPRNWSIQSKGGRLDSVTLISVADTIRFSWNEIEGFSLAAVQCATPHPIAPTSATSRSFWMHEQVCLLESHRPQRVNFASSFCKKLL